MSRLRVLITGGSGFVGSRLVASYAESGAAVRAVARTTPPAAGANVENVALDVRDAADRYEVFAGQDLVIHAAAVLHAKTPREQEVQRAVNVDATRAVVEACKLAGVPRLVHVSSTAAIGISADPAAPADETFRFNLEGVGQTYAVTKRAAEELVLAANGPQLVTVIANPGFLFGRHGTGYRGRAVIERVLGRRLVVVTGGGLSVAHVDDAVDGIRRIAADGGPGERYILSGENLSFAEIARTVSELADQRTAILTIPDWARNRLAAVRSRLDKERRTYLEPRYAYPYYSSKKARRELGYAPRPFSASVADALEFLGGR